MPAVCLRRGCARIAGPLLDHLIRPGLFAIAVKAASNAVGLRASKYEIASFLDLVALSSSSFSVTDDDCPG